VPEVIEFIEGYAVAADAPVHPGTTVSSVRVVDGTYRVVTDRGTWHCQAVVLATGTCNVAAVPAAAESVPAEIEMISPLEYRNVDQLGDGGVLVVGASATGLQLADEIQRSGRQVTISVGNHVRMPRMYRGKDIQWWMDASGLLDEGYQEVDDITRARKVPSPQLVGAPDRRMLDLNALMRSGVEIRGRLGMIRDGVALFSGGLRNQCKLADLKMNRLLDTIDEWALENGFDEPSEPERLPPTEVGDEPMTLDLNDGSIRTIVWATGFRPDYSWLHVDVLDHKGRIRHDGGVTTSPGMYLIGASFLRRRKSSFIHGAGDDAAELTEHLADYLAGQPALTV
jgi:putative flavoprotein involved in K+ transport